jgi:hypothetical protein
VSQAIRDQNVFLLVSIAIRACQCSFTTTEAAKIVFSYSGEIEGKATSNQAHKEHGANYGMSPANVRIAL